jgi:hypothetical protein
MTGYPDGETVVATGELVLRAFIAVGEDELPDGE